MVFPFSVDGTKGVEGRGDMNRRSRIRSLLVLATLAGTSGCYGNAGEVGAVSETGSTTGSAGEDVSDTTEEPTDGPSETDTEPTGESGVLPSDCTPGEVYGCCGDADLDGVPFDADIDPTVPNAPQLDTDQDGIVDEIDLCPLVADASGTNTQDSDNDGIGNACDLCPSTPESFNEAIGPGTLPDYMRVRGLPLTGDFDGDGVGDACDNCPTVPNCYALGAGDTFDGTIPEIDGVECQADADADGIGDACDPDLVGETTIGMGDTDDLDQDGIINVLDACPRLPLDEALRGTCDGPSDCGPFQACTDNLCNHVDYDIDGIGDRCDTCAHVANPFQALSGGGVDDDSDGDRVGEVCELGAEASCGERKNPARIAYHPVSAGGACCTVELVVRPGNELARADECFLDDSGECTNLRAPSPADAGVFLPVRLPESCTPAQEEALECVALPASLASTPGIVSVPPGCSDALEAAGLNILENQLSTGADADAPWLQTCRRPQLDFDFDGLGNVCDTCPFGWDPSNTPYVDQNGRLWPNDGAVCNGAYLPC